VAFPRRRHTQVAELPWRTDDYGASDQLVGGSVLRVDAATHVTGSGVVTFDVVIRGLTWAIAEANAGSGGFLAQVIAEAVDVKVDAVAISLENEAVEADVVALENAPRACNVVQGAVAAFPPVDVEGYPSLAAWLPAALDEWDQAPENVKKEATYRARIDDFMERSATAVAARTGKFLRRAGDPVGPFSRAPVAGGAVRAAVVGIVSSSRITFRGTNFTPDHAAVVSCQAELRRAADEGASFRRANGVKFGKLWNEDVDYAIVPVDFPVIHNRSVRIDGSQRGRNGSLQGQYVAERRYLWATCVEALLDDPGASIDNLAFRKQHAIYGLEDETQPHRAQINDWEPRRPPGWVEPERRSGARRRGGGAS
jgi:hypothetical protein